MGLFHSKRKANDPKALTKTLELCFCIPIAKVVYVLVKARVPDIIEEHGGSMRTEDIAREGGFKNVDVAYRLLRAAEALDLFRLNRKTQEWSNSEEAKMMVEGHPGSSTSLIRHVLHESYLGYINLDKAALDGTSEESISSFEIFSGGVPYWEWLDSLEDKSIIQNFNSLMVDLTKRGMSPILEGFDWESLGENKKVADIGGGKGHLVKAIIDQKKNDTIIPIVFDTEHMIEDAKTFWKEYKGKHVVSLVSGDFFTLVPEADVYILKHILHDWSDEKSIQILKTVHASASRVKNSRLLIIEVVLDEGRPLSLHDAFLDIQMMAMVDGKERSEAQWKSLLGSSGFELKKIHAANGARLSIIEATCA